MLNALDYTLVYKTFLVGCSITLADYAVFEAVSANASLSALKNLTRWAKHINSSVPVELQKSFGHAAQVAIPVAQFDSVVEAAPATAKASQASVNGKTVVPSSAQPPAAPSSTEEASNTNKSDDNCSALDPTKLDIRVGHVLKCWNHPDSDKLLCEEVDLGGGEVRLIASGLRAFYSAEQLQDRRVVVLANLKERSMAGFKSQVWLSGREECCTFEPLHCFAFITGHGVVRGEQGPQRGAPAGGARRGQAGRQSFLPWLPHRQPARHCCPDGQEEDLGGPRSGGKIFLPFTLYPAAHLNGVTLP